jgi:heat shock protein HslJ
MKKQLVIIGFASLLVYVGLSGCTSPISGTIGEWCLLSYGDADNPTYALPDVNTTIQFNSDRTFGGNVGCNIFGGNWKPTIDGGISFSNIVSTEMYCEETWEQESAVLGLFSNNAKLQIIWDDNDTMTITNSTSTVKLARFIQGTGTIQYIDLEGGFYGIIGDDQEHYDPINLPEVYKQDNLRVEFKARVSPSQYSIHQWGKLIYILEIKQLVTQEI